MTVHDFIEVDVDGFKQFVIGESKPVNDCFMIDTRCVRGDKKNVLFSGKRARYPREARLLERIINIVNSWMIKNRINRIPSINELGKYVATEVDDRGAMDAIHVDKRCFRGNSMASGRSRYPREKALLRQVLSVMRDFIGLEH